MVRGELERLLHPPRGLRVLPLLGEQRGLRAQRLGALRRRGEQGLLPLVERPRLVESPGAPEQLARGLQVGPVGGVQLERILVADRRAAQIAQPVAVDAAHRVVDGSRGRLIAQGRRLARQLFQHRPGCPHLGVARFALGGGGGDLGGDDLVHRVRVQRREGLDEVDSSQSTVHGFASEEPSTVNCRQSTHISPAAARAARSISGSSSRTTAMSR